jgi:hypothetical protein
MADGGRKMRTAIDGAARTRVVARSGDRATTHDYANTQSK